MKQELYDELVAYITMNQDKFYRLAFSYVKNQEEALDVVQNAVCKALEKYDAIKDGKAIKTWFYRILVNESLSALKKQKRTLLSKTGEMPELQYIEKGFESYEELNGQIGKLKDDVQSIIRLRFFEQMTLEEIAQIMNMNLNTVKTKLYRGLKSLKNIMEEEVGA